MPYGIAPVPEIRQSKLHKALAGLKGIFSVTDDIIVFGSEIAILKIKSTIFDAVDNADITLLTTLDLRAAID